MSVYCVIVGEEERFECYNNLIDIALKIVRRYDMLDDDDENFDYDWEKFYRKGEKVLKLAWIGVIGLIFVLVILTHTMYFKWK